MYACNHNLIITDFEIEASYHCFLSLGYLYKNYFKAIAPALPSIGGGTSTTLVREELPKVTAPPMTTKIEEKPTTKRRRRRRKKTTVGINLTNSTVISARGIDESNDEQDTFKTVLK